MYNATRLWYTDLFKVYRSMQKTKLGVTMNEERILIASGCRGRIYRKSSPSLNNNPQASELAFNDQLMCDVEIDIKAGDEIVVWRGYHIGKSTEEGQVYIAGQPADYYVPFGGVKPDVEHKQVPLQNTQRSEAYVKISDEQ